MAEKSVSLEMDGHIFHMLDFFIEYIDQEKKRIYNCIMSELEHDIEIYVDTQFSKDSNGEPKGSVDAEKFMAYCKRFSEDVTSKYFDNPKISEKFKSTDELTFRELLGKEYSRMDVVISFLALLELIKGNFIMVIQSSLFEDIKMKRVKEISEMKEFALRNLEL